LLQRLDRNDRLCICKLHPGEFSGFLSHNVQNWINSRLCLPHGSSF
jgi:hypothetical protein